MTAFENRAFETCITLSKQFLADYPDSPGRDPVMIRMGESAEGLLDQRYYKPMEEGMDEASARDYFLSAFSGFDCWETRNGNLVYNKSAFEQLLKEKPESNYSDEATYNLIVWEYDYQNDPQKIKREIADLENVITLYPTTSLKGKILFKIGYRYHLLYELYQYSPDISLRSTAKAQESRTQAEYVYRLCSSSQGTDYAKKAFHNLELLKRGERLSGEGE